MSASREKKRRKDQEESGIITPKKQAQQKEAKERTRSRIITTVVTVVIVLVFASLIVFNSGMIQNYAAAVSVGTQKFSPAIVTYYYWDGINSMSDYLSYFVDTETDFKLQVYDEETGETWADYFTDYAVSSMTDTAVLYQEAQKAGYTLSQESADAIDATIENIELYASYAGAKNGDAYLKSYYGQNSSIKTYREYLLISYTASEYAQYKADSFSFAQDEIDSYYAENKNDFDVVSYRSFLVSAQADEDNGIDEETAFENARLTAEEMASETENNEDAFIALALENATEDDKETYSDPDATLNSRSAYSSASTYIADWLFDEARISGQTVSIEASSGYYIVYFLDRERNDYDTVNVRHILIKPATSGEDSTSTDEDWAEAEEKAAALYDEWKNGAATEDSFAELANNNSEDTGSNTNGGLYESVYKGYMVTEFDEWIFDASRRVGDTGIVKTTYGYHIMFYSGTGGPYWIEQVTNTLRSNAYSDWNAEAQKLYTVKENSFGMNFVNR